MEQHALDDQHSPRRPESRDPRQIPSNQQVESGVVTEVDFSHEFPISRVRWRPQVALIKD